jgi:hypothetical protein
MNRLIVFGFVVFVTVSGIGAEEVAPDAPQAATAKGRGTIGKLNSQQETDKGEQADSKTSPEPPCIQCLNCYPTEQPRAKTKEEEAKEASLDHLFRRYLYATIIGVAGGFIGLFVLIWQSIISRQAANAARANADAIACGQRAWVTINKISPSKIISPPAVGTARRLWFVFSFINSGKTVARITDVQGRFHIIKTLKDLRPIPDYGQRAIPAETFFGRVVAPKQGFDFAMALEDGTLTGETMAKIRQNELTICAYCRVKYLDFAERPHTSQFCYLYFVPRGVVSIGMTDEERFETGGPKGYNDYT